jgi:hypothetical protein
MFFLILGETGAGASSLSKPAAARLAQPTKALGLASIPGSCIRYAYGKH